MAESIDPVPDVQAFDQDDAGYSWWRDAHPAGYILAVRARRPPMLHLATCRDVDRDQSRSLKAKGARQLCAEMKSALRACVKQELPDERGLLARCPKCEP